MVLIWIFDLEDEDIGPLPIMVGSSVRARFSGVSSITGSWVRPCRSIFSK